MQSNESPPLRGRGVCVVVARPASIWRLGLDTQKQKHGAAALWNLSGVGRTRAGAGGGQADRCGISSDTGVVADRTRDKVPSRKAELWVYRSFYVPILSTQIKRSG